MLKLELSTQFKKDLKKINKQGKNKKKLDDIIGCLQKEDLLAKKYLDHDLVGNWRGYRECHIASDWLLIYKICRGHVRLLRLSRTGSHSDLFKK
ncbi:MAG: type II toxin-antitoxin system mRNA interferase toxin, RelE/StbE family [Thiotrichales bacterium]|nr:MAG: type II toxin-antitoxin system mRNA interferase toxin, RelE/StbE family [Thiotrichales bacterium]